MGKKQKKGQAVSFIVGLIIFIIFIFLVVLFRDTFVLYLLLFFHMRHFFFGIVF